MSDTNYPSVAPGACLGSRENNCAIKWVVDLECRMIGTDLSAYVSVEYYLKVSVSTLASGF